MSQRWRPENLDPLGAGLLDSDYKEKDPRPGTAVTDDSRARLRPEISHVQATGTLVIKVTEGGLPGPQGAAISYRQAKDSADNARGWNQPNYLQGWIAQEWSDSDVWDDFGCVTIPKTQLVIGFVQNNGGAPSLARTRIFDPESWTWGASTAVPWEFGAFTSAVALVHLSGPDRVLAIVHSGTAAQSMQIWATEDDGLLWEEYSLKPIRDPAANEQGAGFGIAIKRAKAAALSDGSVVTVVEDGAGAIAQLASADLGVTFALVEPALAAFGSNIDVFALPDQTFAMTYIDDATGFPRIRFIGSAFEPIGSAVDLLIAGSQMNSLTATVDADGAIYVFGARDTNFARVEVFLSTDNGRTWTAFDWGIVDTGDNSAFLLLTGCCATAGYIMLQHQWSVSIGDEGGSVGTIIAAGWTNATAVDDGFFRNALGNPVDGPRQFERFGFGHQTGLESNSWIPIERPGDTIYTAGGVLGELEPPGRFNVTSIGAGVDDYTFTSATGIEDCVIKADLDCTVLGSQAAMIVGFDVEISDPGVPRSFRIQIRVSTTGFAVHNFHSGADIGTVTIDMLTNPLQIALHFVFESTGLIGDVHTYYRRKGNTIWTEGPSASNIVKAAAAANLSRFILGHHAVTTSVSHWTFFGWAFDGGIAFGEDKVDGKRIADLPYPLIAAGDGLSDAKAFLSLRSGPGIRGEVYTIAAEADHGVHKLFPGVSPSRDETWESTSDLSLQKISVDMGADTRLGQSFALVMGVMGANVRLIRLLGDIGGTPTLIGTWDGATGFTGLDYILTGDQLAPLVPTTADAARWIQAMEFAGGHVLLPGGKARRIVLNSAGGWTQSATVVPHFTLEGLDGSESATGICDLVSPSGYMVCHLGTTAATFRRHFQIEIAIQSTPDARFRVGNILLGGLIVPGKSWSNGWSLSTRPNTRSRRDPHGTEYRQQRGPNVRTYSIAWPDGVKLHDLRGGDLDVDYIGSSATGASALAGRDDVLGQLVGAMAESKGFSAPSMLLGDVPDASGVTVTDPTLYAYGLLTGTVDAQNVFGNEGVNEFYRISGIQLVEVR